MFWDTTLFEFKSLNEASKVDDIESRNPCRFIPSVYTSLKAERLFVAFALRPYESHIERVV